MGAMDKELVGRVDRFLAKHFLWLGLLAMGLGLRIGEPLAPCKGAPPLSSLHHFIYALGCRVRISAGPSSRAKWLEF